MMLYLNRFIFAKTTPMNLLKIKLFLFGITIICLFSGCKSYEQVTVKEPEQVAIQSATLNNMNLLVKMPIHNPNFYPIKVKRLQANVYINQNAVGKIKNNETIKIPANSDKVHEVEININYSEIFDSGFSLMAILRANQFKLQLDGSLTIKSFLVKKEVQFKKSKAIEMNK
jgi:LEA14-like dessication related protein